MNRKHINWFIFFTVLFLLAMPGYAQPGKRPPNFIIILADDLGYGDLGVYGHPTIRTPSLDRLAQEGTKFTQFYVAANVCTPSRAGLLTGRLPVRNGIFGGLGVFFPHSSSGLPAGEVTIAKALQSKGYHTGIIGKWHLGSLPQYLPLNYGFDSYFGIPYSNDMIPDNKYHVPYPPLPLYRDDKVLETNPDQRLLTRRYTQEAISFINQNKDKPFFLYYPNNAPHVPLFASEKFSGKSKRGNYGDVVEELDWSVGQITATLKKLKLDKNTFVLFLSDNGPWLTERQDGGSAGLLSDGKASTYEGGMRVPAIAWWPGVVPGGKINNSIASTLDILPTLLSWAGAPLPKDRILDGNDISEVFAGKKESGREVIYYYDAEKLFAVRKGAWKAQFTTHSGYSPQPPQQHDPPLLFNIENDPSEKYEVGAQHPDIIEKLKKIYQEQLTAIKPVDAELDKFLPGKLDSIFKTILKSREQQNQPKRE